MAKPHDREPRKIRRMFDGIAPRYDLVNHLLSANLDRRWRRGAAAELAGGSGGRVLDLCGGTGDLSLAVADIDGIDRVVCCDFSHQMLSRAASKFRDRRVDRRCLLLEADGLRLPFAAASFDAVTIGFGVRNFADLEDGLRQVHRVLRPGGRLVILEFSQPSSGWLGRIYRLYLRRILPRIGDGVSGRSGPYRYLAGTIAAFPDPATLAGRIRDAGFSACGWKLLSSGIVAIHTAYK